MAKPVYSFTLPSVADDTPLACRIYHPKHLETIFGKIQSGGDAVKGAIVAHPYPPLGGSFDDPVVLAVTETLLKQGFVVGTFNFRGAGGSKGKTTWTGRAEREDYNSFAGFIIHYTQHLEAHDETAVLSPSISTTTAGQGLSTPVTLPGRGATPPFRLLLAGYSYGSLMLSRLPPIKAIIDRFQSAERGTAAAEIILRAKRLAQETHETVQASQTPTSPRGRQLAPEDAAGTHQMHGKPSPVKVGGEETDPSERRKSRDSRRSADIVRKGAEIPHRIKAHIRRQSSSVRTGPTRQSSNSTIDSGQAPRVLPSYLLVSPLLPPVSHALCPPSSMSSLFGKAKPDSLTGLGKPDHPSLTIWGAADSFTSSRKLRTWAEKLSNESASDFEWAQIEGAGHFWREDGVMQELQQRIAAWLKAS